MNLNYLAFTQVAVGITDVITNVAFVN